MSDQANPTERFPPNKRVALRYRAPALDWGVGGQEGEHGSTAYSEVKQFPPNTTEYIRLAPGAAEGKGIACGQGVLAGHVLHEDHDVGQRSTYV